MKKSFMLICVVMLTMYTYGQATFEKVIGVGGDTYANDIHVISDGGYIVTGTYNYTDGSFSDIFLMRMSAQGDTLWFRRYGGFAEEMGNNVIETPDGGFLVAGSTNSFGAGGTDALLIKTDNNGNILWSKTYGTVSNDAAYGLVQTYDGNYVFSGNESTAGINGKVHLVKVDPAGSVLWSQTYGYYLRKNFAFALRETSDHGFIIGGYENFYISTNDEFSMIRTDSAGNKLWYKTFGDSEYDHNFSIGTTPDGGYILAGINFNLAGYNYDVNIVRADVDGNLVWSKNYGSSGMEEVYAINATSDGGFVFAGSSNGFSAYSNAYYGKVDGDGNLLWSRITGGTGYDGFYAVQETPDGRLIFAGVKDEVYGSAGNMYIVKTDSYGNTSCGTTEVASYTITPPTISSIITAYGTSTQIVADPALSSASGTTVINLCCAAPGGLYTSNIGPTQVKLHLIPEPGAVYYELQYKRVTDINWKHKKIPAAATIYKLKNLTCGTDYIWKIRTYCDLAGTVSDFSEIMYFSTASCKTELPVEIHEITMTVYPNPASNQLHVEYTIPDDYGEMTMQLMDLEGTLIMHMNVSGDGSNEVVFDLQNIPSGIYIVRMQVDGTVLNRKCIVQH
ncbi:MAG: T9SS type A sorting domain-containing protein [Chitinophagales bacterium]